MRGGNVASAPVIGMCLCAITMAADAAYREPKGVYALFPRGLVKRIAMPGETEGFMFKTFRRPILIAGKNRSHLVILTNGVDHKTWSFATILSVMLRNYCGIRNAAFTTALIKKAYASAPIVLASAGTGKSDPPPVRRESEIASGCKVTLEIKGRRLRKITATFEPAK